MSLAEEDLRRSRMSWDDYLALPEDVRAEWVDGEVVVSPPVGPDHGTAVIALGSILCAHLPALRVMTEVGVRLPHNRLRSPDLTVVRSRPTGVVVTDAPVLVVEVLSPGTRREDTIRKPPEYAAAGIGQYWVVDPEQSYLDVYTNVDGTWADLLHLDDEHPTGEVAVDEHGVVPVDLREVFPT